MRINLTRRGDWLRAVVAEGLEIASIEHAKESLMQLLEGEGQIEVILSGVTECDTSGVQLLLYLHRTAAKRSLRLRLLQPSPALDEAFGLLGRRDLFEEHLQQG
jgi:anti-anti-sigma regulatory factor